MSDRISALISKTNESVFKRQAEIARVEASIKSTAEYRLHNQRHPDRAAARRAIKKALDRGDLLAPTVCDIADDDCKGRIEAHHWHGYDEEHWLDVLFLCRHHHLEMEQ